ncbi:hypothetical protein [Liquorilactobacillus oeni]|uniref:PhnB-like domain-containing protein n=1 Tax=Liquorilactobacillus oeni DSM 19972 TaxID=1423777 RepID=A0A0R1MLE1_9LACO|nr:hypothetical protein [Liquorilactobacillus oeni]KRL05395.1 hypothetical protein FD46_GL000803 [Liquorilactobacillus oeni DSM 19972]
MEIYLNFTNQAETVISFYEKVFNTSVKNVLRFGDDPSVREQKPPEDLLNLIMYSELMIDGTRVLVSDVPQQTKTLVKGNNITLVIKPKKPNISLKVSARMV